MAASRLGSSSVHKVIGGKACESGLDDVTFPMLFRVFVDKTIGPGCSDSGSEDTLAFLSGPLPRLFAGAEGFNGAGGQSGPSCLSKSLFAPFAMTMRAITVTAATATATARP